MFIKGEIRCDCCGEKITQENSAAMTKVEIPIKKEVFDCDLMGMVSDTKEIIFSFGKATEDYCTDCIPFIMRFALKRVEQGEMEYLPYGPVTEVNPQLKEEAQCTLEQ